MTQQRSHKQQRAKAQRRSATTALVFKGKRGWRFRLVARNGEIIAASEAYTRRGDAVRGAHRIDSHATVRYQ